MLKKLLFTILFFTTSLLANWNNDIFNSSYKSNNIPYKKKKNYKIEIEIGKFQQKISGYMDNDNTRNFFNNTDVNLNDLQTGNLGMKTQIHSFFKIDLKHSTIKYLPNIRFIYTTYNNTGTGIASIKYKNNYYKVKATTTFLVKDYDIYSYYNLFNNKQIIINGGIGFNTGYGSGSIISNYKNIEEKGVAPLPYFEGDIIYNYNHKFSIYTNSRFFLIKLKGYYRTIDNEIGFKYKYNKFYIKAGYREQQVEGSYKTYNIAMNFKGFTSSIGYTF